MYESSEEMDFAIACANHDLGLPSFDEFIDSLPNGVGKDELMWLRNETLRAYLEDNESAFLGWLQAMWLRWSIALNLPRLWPTLLHGEKFQNSKRGYSKLYRVAEKILIDNGADYPAKDVWRKLESLAKKGHPAIQEVEGDVDSDEAKHVFVYWIDDKGKEQKTSFKQFQSQLSGHRKTLPNF